MSLIESGWGVYAGNPVAALRRVHEVLGAAAGGVYLNPKSEREARTAEQLATEMAPVQIAEPRITMDGVAEAMAAHNVPLYAPEAPTAA